MKHHCVLWYFVTDALADARAWAITCLNGLIIQSGKWIIILRQHLWSMYMDERQMIELIEADARAQLRAAKEAKP